MTILVHYGNTICQYYGANVFTGGKVGVEKSEG